MPPKTKRQRLSAEAASVAWEKLRQKRLSELEVDASHGVFQSQESSPSRPEASVSPTPETSTPAEYNEPTTSSATERAASEILSQFSEEWLKVLDSDDKTSLAMFLCHIITVHINLNNTETAEMAA